MPDWWSAVESAPAPRAAPSGGDDVESRIRSVAAARGFANPELLIATARQESGLNPLVKGGDAGRSWGLYQEHDAGRGYGLTVPQRQDVEASTERAINEFNAIRQRYPDADPGTWAAKAQRPLDPVGYARSVNTLLGQRPAVAPAAVARAAPAQAPAAPTAQTGPAPAWHQAIPGWQDASFRYGRDEGPGVQPLPDAQPNAPASWQQLVGGAAPQGDRGPVTRPLAGNVITKAGQPYWSFGGGAHAGIDIAAKAGTPVRTPVAGEVVANLAAGQNPLGLSKGYGRAVAVRDPSGDVHIFGHGAPDFGYLPVGTKVNVGDVVSTVGSPKTKLPGEATEGEHLHWEIRGGGDYGKQINPEQWLPKQTVPATNTPRKAITTEPGPSWWSAV